MDGRERAVSRLVTALGARPWRNSSSCGARIPRVASFLLLCPVPRPSPLEADSPSCLLSLLLLLGRHAASVSLFLTRTPLERTRFYLSLSPVNGLCRPAPRFSIVSLSLFLFRFHLLSPYNSPTAFIKSRVYLWKREGERGLIVAGKIGERTNTGVSALLFLSLSLSVSKSTRSFAFRSSNASLLRGTISCTCSCWSTVVFLPHEKIGNAVGCCSTLPNPRGSEIRGFLSRYRGLLIS